MTVPPRWEYLIDSRGTEGELAERLNELGAEGWELLLVFDRQPLQLLFKRPRP
ncbi:MAG: hypothetical protein ABIJ48_06240 [Actinomycetota bacterium]